MMISKRYSPAAKEQWHQDGYKKSRLQGYDDQFHEWIGKEPDLTLEEIRARCAGELDVKIGINALWQRLDKLGLSFKKRCTQASKAVLM